MKKKLKITVALAVLGWTVVCGGMAFDVKQLSPAHQALYGAMKAGYVVGSEGGTEADMQQVFVAMKSGRTNAVQEWLNRRR